MNKLPPGFRQITKDPVYDSFKEELSLDKLKSAAIEAGPSTISLKEIKDYLLKIFVERAKTQPWKGITYHTGFNEDGTEYEYWNINGSLTGRGGFEMFTKAVKELELKNNKAANEQSTRPRSSKRIKVKSRKSKRNL